MEHSASCRAFSTVLERFDCLREAYTCFLTGTCPSQCVACVILSGLVPGNDRENLRVTSAELSCISLTLVEKMTSNLASRSLSPAVSSYCRRMLTVLFQDMDLMSQLLQQFQAKDPIISHLAAKTTSACVIYQLHTSGTVSPIWQRKCVQAFYISLPGPELDTCLWSLTEVLKQLLKGAHQDILWKLLAAFDSSLSALCSKFLSEERDETMQCLVDLPSSSGRWGTTFCLLLDLLELLTACSVICGAGVCLESPRMTYLHSSALLRTISCSSEYFVKKRALLLLKRAVHQKAGEDWALGEVLLTGLKHKHFDSDMSVLSQSVLTAMAADWLHSVQVESSSFFGGTRSIRGEEGQKPDCVMLRAVSLLLLKSMELHIQTAGGTAVDSGVDRATAVSGYLHSLWGFLRRCGVQLTENTHQCCWVSLLFGEQDDDMMEAAKALLSIFLHHRMYSGLDDFAVLEAACASGCNPHCHFLLLLQSISFDHSILLDFLISTETCFLEYFVRYLKYLRADWQGFTAACGRIRSLHFHLSLQQSLTASCAADTLKVTCKGESDRAKFSSCAQSEPVGRVSLAAGFHLVEYDSSDESDPENMEVSRDEPEALVCDKSTISALDVKQDISGPTVPIRQKQYEVSYVAPHPGPVALETLARAVLCMSKLKEVVTRLHTKKLFPYNPSSLLKLLAQIENCSKLSRLLHFNK